MTIGKNFNFDMEKTHVQHSLIKLLSSSCKEQSLSFIVGVNLLWHQQSSIVLYAWLLTPKCQPSAFSCPVRSCLLMLWESVHMSSLLSGNWCHCRVGLNSTPVKQIHVQLFAGVHLRELYKINIIKNHFTVHLTDFICKTDSPCVKYLVCSGHCMEQKESKRSDTPSIFEF